MSLDQKAVTRGRTDHVAVGLLSCSFQFKSAFTHVEAYGLLNFTFIFSRKGIIFFLRL